MHRTIALILTSIILTGCKVAVIAVEGGEVQSIASGTCVPAVPGVTGAVCIHEVANTSYSETFTAVPEPGWEFVKWNSGGDFFCEDSTNPNCLVSNAGWEGNSGIQAGIEAVVATNATFYIMPIFAESGLPITETVTANGKEWAQVELFYNLSPSEINAVCPAGSCVEGGILNGFNVTGWTWASNSDFVDLLNSYGVSPPLVAPANGGTINYTTVPEGWGVQFFNSWNADTGNSLCAQLVEGWLSDMYLTSYYDGGVGEGCSNPLLDVVALAPLGSQQGFDSVGAWFYRIP